MARTRLSTTVDRHLLEHARRTRAGVNDAELIDAALAALLSLAAQNDARRAVHHDDPRVRERGRLGAGG